MVAESPNPSGDFTLRRQLLKQLASGSGPRYQVGIRRMSVTGAGKNKQEGPASLEESGDWRSHQLATK